MQNVRQAKEENQRRKAAEQKTRSEQVSTVATFTPPQRDRSTRDDRAKEAAAAPERMRRNLPRPLEPDVRGLPPLPVASRNDVSVAATSVSTSPTKKLPSPIKNVSSPTKKLFSPPYASVSPSLSATKTSTSPFSVAATTRPLPQPHSSVPAVMKPRPYSEKFRSAPTGTAEVGSVEYLSRLTMKQHREKDLEEEPWVKRQTARGGRVEHLLPRLPAAGTTNVLSVASCDRDTRSPSSSPPPPVPPYNPAMPDRFPLSNKAEYFVEYKKQTHAYEVVNQEEVKQLQQKIPTPLDSTSAREGATFEVPVRPTRRRNPGDALPEGVGGHVMEGRGGGGRGMFDVEKVRAREETETANMIISDLSPLQVACAGLPSSGEQCKIAVCLSPFFSLVVTSP